LAPGIESLRHRLDRLVEHEPAQRVDERRDVVVAGHRQRTPGSTTA
jgi:hypothetical protein